MDALTTPKPCYIALMPDEAFAAKVLNYKRRTARRIGPQLFLDDPPHLTLYLASFPHVPSLSSAVQAVAQGLRAPAATVCGWHVFRDDPLNGNHTLVCDIAPEDRRDLAVFQQQICAAVSLLRDPECSRARYLPTWRNLSEEARANVSRWGFPFVGSIWRPHVTIASIRPADWDVLWPELEMDAPGGVVRFPKLCLYALEEGQSVLFERFDLESAP